MEFNQREIYERVKDQFAKRGFDVQFGSNIQQIQNSMAYLVSMLNQNTQINVRETILSSQSKRNMILEGQRVLGYEALPKRSFQYEITLKIENNSLSDYTFSVDDFHRFESNGNTYYYIKSFNDPSGTNPIAVEAKDLSNNPGVAYYKVKVKEGNLKTYAENSSLVHEIRTISDGFGQHPEEYVDIPFTDVEEDGIFVFIDIEDVNGTTTTETWDKSEVYLLDKDTELQRKFIREDNIEFGTPRIYFKYGTSGSGIPQGSVVKSNVLISKGSQGAGDVNSFEYSDLSYDPDIVISIENVRLLRPGTDEEDDQSIKNNAPVFNNTQGRIITMHDYKAIQTRQGSVQHAQIWDGFEEYEKLQGHIWFSFVPENRKSVFTDSGTNKTWTLENWYDEEQIFMEDEDYHIYDGSSNNTGYVDIQELFNNIRQYAIPTLQFNYRQPVYLDFDIKVNVQQYNQRERQNDAKREIFQNIRDFFHNSDRTKSAKDIEQFNQKYFNSDLIDNVMDNLKIDTKFDIKPFTSVTMNKRHVIKNIESGKADDGNLVFRLGAEFLPIVDQHSNVIVENLPSIETPNFLGTSNTLEMPSSFPTLGDVLIQPILLNTQTVGQYRIFHRAKEVEIVIDTSSLFNGVDTILSYLNSQDLSGEDNRMTINVEYPSPNISVRKNTFPRLKSVQITSGEIL